MIKVITCCFGNNFKNYSQKHFQKLFQKLFQNIFFEQISKIISETDIDFGLCTGVAPGYCAHVTRLSDQAPAFCSHLPRVPPMQANLPGDERGASASDGTPALGLSKYRFQE